MGAEFSLQQYKQLPYLAFYTRAYCQTCSSALVDKPAEGLGKAVKTSAEGQQNKTEIYKRQSEPVQRGSDEDSAGNTGALSERGIFSDECGMSSSAYTVPRYDRTLRRCLYSAF